jgi:hypothetical protein
MRKTNKVDLCHALESDVTSISQLTPFDRSSMVLIQDDMPLLHIVPSSWKREVGIGPIGKDFFCCYVITARSKYQHTAKYYRYDKKLSIKSTERDRRSSSLGDHKVFQ